MFSNTHPQAKNLSKISFLLLLILSPFFFIGGPTLHSTALFRALWDCGHILFFSTLILFIQFKINISGWRFFLIISAIVFVGGGAIEIIQAHIGRDGNWEDLLRDLTGTWIGLFWLQKNNKWLWPGRCISIALMLPTLSVVYNSALMQWQAEENFPVLSNFEHSTDIYRWNGHIEISQDYVAAGKNSLKVNFNTNRYSALAFNEYLGDWSHYHTLSVDIYNPQQTAFEISLRINDVQHELDNNSFNDRFNQRYNLNYGWNHIEIPLDAVEHGPASRLMNMHEIMRVVFFTRSLPQPRTIYLDNLLLQ